MNSLVRLASLRHLIRTPTVRNVLAITRNKSTTTPDDPFYDEAEEIKRIQENEKLYFQNIKKSFDNLRTNRSVETLDEKRSRLMYQSRKRGTTENGILLSNFSADNLPKMTEKELDEYDDIINNLHNEWDLYYWLTNAVPIPDELNSNSILLKMKAYCLNNESKGRFLQPDLAKLD